MLITKEPSYILIRILLTLLAITKNVFSRPKYPWIFIKPLHEPKCYQEQCKHRSKEILDSLDISIDPCMNFYKYVCGGWQQKHPVPPSRTMWNVESEFDHQLYLRIRDQLEKPVTSKDSINLKRSKQHYQICSLLPNLHKLSLEEVRTRIKEAGPWPMVMSNKEEKTALFNWADVHYYYFKLSGDAGLFDIDISLDPQENYKPILELKAVHSPFGLIHRDGPPKEQWLKDYYHFLVQLIEKVEKVPNKPFKISEKSLLQSIKEVFTFRKKLMEAVTEEVSDLEAYHPITLKELQFWFDSKMQTQDSKKINWLKTLNSLFFKSSNGLITTNTRINMKHKKYFFMLREILSETSAEIILNHLHMYFVERYLLLDTELETMAHKLMTVNGVNVALIRQLDERWEKCILKSNARQIIDEEYISRILTNSVREDIVNIINTMKNILIIHIKDSTWLDEDSKAAALHRINDVKINIGLSNYPLNVIKLCGKYVNPNSAHAFYSVDTHRLFISGSYLQSPMYTENLPYVVNYASIGSLIGHELYHMFDKTGLTYPIYPEKKCKTLWTRKMFHIYEEKTQCIVEQFNRPVQGLLNVRYAQRNDGKKTYNENFADVMSIRTSYDAFKKRLLAKNNTCTILPNLGNINCEKLFFISYAMTFCANIPQWKILRQVQYNKHSVPELRVNIPVANMPEFSQAFQCNKDSYENSIKRCYLWD